MCLAVKKLRKQYILLVLIKNELKKRKIFRIHFQSIRSAYTQKTLYEYILMGLQFIEIFKCKICILQIKLFFKIQPSYITPLTSLSTGGGASSAGGASFSDPNITSWVA